MEDREWAVYKNEWGYIDKSRTFITCGYFAKKDDYLYILNLKKERLCKYDCITDELFCTHDNPIFTSDDEQGICQVCGDTCNWSWGKDIDDDIGEISVREINEWTGEIKRGNLLEVICKIKGY